MLNQPLRLVCFVALLAAIGIPSPESTFAQPPRQSLRPNFSNAFGAKRNQRNNFFVLRAFDGVIGQARQSTLRVMAGKEQIALATAVTSDGWLVTKASELPKGEQVVCRMADGTDEEAQIIRIDHETDIAVLRIDRKDLTPIKWSQSPLPRRGSWVATADPKSNIPSAVGVVSTGVQVVSRSKPVLGVHLSDGEGGAGITRVLWGTGAYVAGLLEKDLIKKVGDARVNSRSEMLDELADFRAGDLVPLTVQRADRTFNTLARMMDLTEELLDDTEMEVTGPISARSTDFPRVFLHDTVLEPNQCGGPLLNLEGKVIGINIARAGRVKSYAIPADTLRPTIDRIIAEAQLVSRPTKPAASPAIR